MRLTASSEPDRAQVPQELNLVPRSARADANANGFDWPAGISANMLSEVSLIYWKAQEMSWQHMSSKNFD